MNSTSINQPQVPEPALAIEEVDVLIVGAGISGLGVAVHLQRELPQRSWMIVETRASFGGTWDFHKYPGIRSDSDFYTFGYSFKPWSGSKVAPGPRILEYLEGVIDEHSLKEHIQYNTRVLAAAWSSSLQRWDVRVRDQDSGVERIVRCQYLDMCQGYYDFENPYMPSFPGSKMFKGDIVHPMQWDPDYDYVDKKVVVIGSGATAATLVPEMSEAAQHVTMLQRSPTYFYAGRNSVPIASQLERIGIKELWVHPLARWVALTMERALAGLSRAFPNLVKRLLQRQLRRYISGNQIAENFTPNYRPWHQRIAFVPEGDLFRALQGGRASVVTDHIEHFDEGGIVLQSGKRLEADLIISATGFQLLFLGGIPFTVDGVPVDVSNCFTHRGIMIEGLPNLFHYFGYLRSSWTLRVELVAAYQCRLMKYMDAQGVSVCTPTRLPSQADLPKGRFIPAEDFDPGYMQRGGDLFPKNSGQWPWTTENNYYLEREEIPAASLSDPTLVYT